MILFLWRTLTNTRTSNPSHISLFLPFPLFFLSFVFHQLWPGMTLAGASVLPVSLPSTSFPHRLEHDLPKSVKSAHIVILLLRNLECFTVISWRIKLKSFACKAFQQHFTSMLKHQPCSISSAKKPFASP